jgi:superfamily I DNA and RNA helicase
MQTSDLKPSILDLSEEAKYSLIRELRALRREQKPKKITKKKAAKKKAKQSLKQLSIDDILATMDKKQATELLKKLQKKG